MAEIKKFGKDTKKTNDNKLSDLTEEALKAYHAEKAEYRKTNEFFREQGTKRTNKVLKHINALSYMSRYNGTDEQKKSILEEVDKAVANLHKTFEGSIESEGFKL